MLLHRYNLTGIQDIWSTRGIILRYGGDPGRMDMQTLPEGYDPFLCRQAL